MLLLRCDVDHSLIASRHAQPEVSDGILCTQRRETAQDFLPLKGTDHVEFYVGNARQAAYFYRTAFGMSLVAYAGPETGQRDRASYVVQQGKDPLRLHHLAAPRLPHRRARRAARRRRPRHRALRSTTPARPGTRPQPAARAASPSPPRSADDFGRVTTASIAAYGDTIHTFVERGHYNGAFLPGFRADADRHCRPPRRPASTSTTWWATWAGTP